MKLKHTFIQLVFILLTGSLVNAFAGPVYRWIDEDGKVVYGSSPPSGAVGVAKVDSSERISTYKSKKSLGGITIKKRAKLGDVKEEKEVINTPSEQTKQTGEDNDSFTISEQKNQTLTKSSLVAEKPKCDIADSSVRNCSVGISNDSGIDAENVRIALDFGEGTVVPLTGPKAVFTNTLVTYSISDSLLPLKLNSNRINGKTEIQVIIRNNN